MLVQLHLGRMRLPGVTKLKPLKTVEGRAAADRNGLQPPSPPSTSTSLANVTIAGG